MVCRCDYFQNTRSSKTLYIFLIDHFSKYIIGYSIAYKPSPTIIKNILKTAYKNHKPEYIEFVTDGGSKNVNATASNLINTSDISIKHVIAQKDVVFSNSIIEAINKIIKHQFLYPKRNSK